MLGFLEDNNDNDCTLQDRDNEEYADLSVQWLNNVQNNDHANKHTIFHYLFFKVNSVIVTDCPYDDNSKCI